MIDTEKWAQLLYYEKQMFDLDMLKIEINYYLTQKDKNIPILSYNDRLWLWGSVVDEALKNSEI